MNKKEKAYNLVISSPVKNYVSEEKIKKAFERIILCETIEEFETLYGQKTRRDFVIENFSRNDKSYISVYGTCYTIVVEVLRYLSITYDKGGHVFKDGIYDLKGAGSKELNERLIKYLARQIANKPYESYMGDNRFFDKIYEMLEHLYGKNEYLYAEYLNNNDKFLEAFINYYCDAEIKNKRITYDYICANELSSSEINMFFANMNKNILSIEKKSLLNMFKKQKQLEYNDALVKTRLLK